MTSRRLFIAGLSALGLMNNKLFAADKSIEILNVSYDPTRELYQEYNQLFESYWEKTQHQKINVKQSHGGSGKQALAVQHGLAADVVTLALAADIDALNLNGKKLIADDWQTRLPDNSTPYTSTIVFLVRKGNPKNIKDWDDLVKENVQIVTPNPKTSGGARWNFLAAWAYALKQSSNSETHAKQFLKQLFEHVPVLDTGARGSTLSFTQRKIGDVLLAWENEAFLSIRDNPNEYELIIPSISILCEPPVAVVDSVVDKKGSREVAAAYLQYLYSEEAQQVIAKNFYRPRLPAVLEKYSDQFPKLDLVTIDDNFGGWEKTQNKFFATDGIFDQLYS